MKSPRKKKGKFHKVSKKDASPAPQFLAEATGKLCTAEKGNDIDPDALNIVRSVNIKRHPELLHKHRMYEKGGPLRNTLAFVSPDGLVPAERERILKAVCEFDRPFLQSLINAMDLCENGSGFAQPGSARVTSAHMMYEIEHKKTPTFAQLTKYVKAQFGIEMDRKSIEFICKRDGLRISAGKKGRPKVDS